MEVDELREALGPGQPAFRARQVYEALYRGQASSLAEISTLPAQMRREIAARHSIGLPEIATVYNSTDGTRRYLLRLEDGRHDGQLHQARAREKLVGVDADRLLGAQVLDHDPCLAREFLRPFFQVFHEFQVADLPEGGDAGFLFIHGCRRAVVQDRIDNREGG
jgi:hypothetical protein